MRASVLALLVLPFLAAAGSLRSRGIVTKGEMEGTACTADEHERYKIIVCGETLQTCELEWCEKYKHDWKLKFGACNQLGC